MTKTVNHRAWLLVLPVFLVVAFSAVLPLMTVVNYSVQDTFGNNQFFWNGVGWFKELLDPSTDLGGRFLASLGRSDEARRARRHAERAVRRAVSRVRGRDAEGLEQALERLAASALDPEGPLYPRVPGSGGPASRPS